VGRGSISAGGLIPEAKGTCYNRAANRFASLMRLSRRIYFLKVASIFGTVFLLTTVLSAAENWTDATSAFAAKIIAHTRTSRALALTVRNVSSLGDDDVSQIRRQLRAQMHSRGARLTTSKRARITVQVTLSENAGGYIWVADIQNGTSHEVAMLTVARSASAEFHPVVEPLSIRKTRFYEQAEPMLDVVPLVRSVLDPASPATSALVLGLDSVSLYEKSDEATKNGPVWKLMQSVPVSRFRPMTRDARGRLVMGQDKSFRMFLPGEICDGALEPALKVDCHESDDPWPMVVGSGRGAAAYFNADRNFFDGRIRSGDGRALMASPFYSAAILPLKSGALWLLAGLDGHVQMFNSSMDSMGNFEGFGSNITVIQTSCQEGWQALATQPGDYSSADAVQAIDVVNRKAVPASGAVDFAGPVTELWPLEDGSTAIAISHNLKTTRYEAFRLSISCGQ